MRVALVACLLVAAAVPAAATPPQPTFTSESGFPPIIALGQTFAFTFTARNDGAASDDGRIVVSFPSFTLATDLGRVQSSASGDLPGYLEHAPGTAIMDAACQSIAAGYVMAEYVDNAWQNGEANFFNLSVVPRETGQFVILVRSTMHEAGAACAWVNGTPITGDSGYVDQQGYAVRRYIVRVGTTSPPNPTIAIQNVSASTITLGQSVTFELRATNLGGPSPDGRVVIEFPELTDPQDGQWVQFGSAGDLPGYTARPAGSQVMSSTCQPMTADHFVGEYMDDQWLGAEVNILGVLVQPQAVGTFSIDFRCTLFWPEVGPCEPHSYPPAAPLWPTDQQGFPVLRHTVTVLPGVPTPRFPVPVSGIPATITLGESITLTATSINDGLATDDGRISVAFPAFTQPTDGQWVSFTGTSDDTPGYAEYPARSTVGRADCTTMSAWYLGVEYADGAWGGYESESNLLTLTVQPQQSGPFAIDVRTTMRSPAGPCAYANAIPSNGTGVMDDPQGWQVRRFIVNVEPQDTHPTAATWRPVYAPGTGAGARAGAVMVLHGRTLVVYGGTAAEYQHDVWTLDLAPGSYWYQTTPGGPRPLRRFGHSMIYNPREQHAVVYGGYYDDFLGDATVFAFSPLHWWFPVTMQNPNPGHRSGHAAVYDPVRHRMLVIGGYNGTLKNDVWEYLLPGNGVWTQLTVAGTPMPARALHSAIYDPLRDRVLVFGGDGGTLFNDLWALDLAGPTPTWSLLTVGGTPPSARREHTMVYDSYLDRLVVFGGFDGVRKRDIWVLPMTLAFEWEQIYSSTLGPSVRSAHTAVFDPVSHEMLMFGGQTGVGQYSEELWALTFDPSTPALVSFAGADATSERVRLAWQSPDAATVHAAIHRSTEGSGAWTVLGDAVVDGERLSFEDRDIVPGERYGYRLVGDEGGGQEVLDEQWVTVPMPAKLALAGVSPNPVTRELGVAFSLPGSGAASLDLFDLAGRVLEHREVGGLGAGEHRVTLAEARSLPAGLYLVRLSRDGVALTAKACVVR